MTTKRQASKLTEEHRAWLVVKWATYARPTELLREFESTFGFQVKDDLARKYNLTGIRDEEHAKSKGMAKWLPLFRKAREEFEASVKDIAIASSTYRVKKLDEMFEIAFEKRNYKSAALLLEQAAKETGGVFSNRRVLDGAIDHKHVHEEVPMDVKRSALAARIRDAVSDALAAAVEEQREAPSTTAPTIQ